MGLSPVPVDEGVAAAWARLRVALRDAGQRMGVTDSWIAATAIALGVPLVMQDDDHLNVAGLRVIRA
jgi:predicted nucleic acid-binding protein